MKTNSTIRMFCLIVMTTLLSSFFVQQSSAASAAGEAVEIQQPNGARFKAIQKGDEWLNWVETDEGYTIAQKADGYWYYVERYDGNTPIIGSTYAHEAPLISAQKYIKPTLGLYPPDLPGKTPQVALAQGPVGPFSGPILYILTEFSDQSGTTTETTWASFIANNISDFFNVASYGNVTLTPANENFGVSNNGVVGWVNVGYNHPNTGSNTGTANRQLTRDAILAADPYVNFSAYDTNTDGYVDSDELAVVVIAAGYERSYSSNYTPTVWGHKWSLFSSPVIPPTVDGVIVADYHDGAGGYAQFGELHRSTASNQHQATMGIQVHELGHLIFGLPDLYDTDGSSDGVGQWCVMAGGSWGASSFDTYAGETPVLPSAWVKYNRGWVDGSDGNGTESMTGAGENSATSSNSVYKASTCNTPNEYFLVENRQPAGYDRGLERWLGTGFGGLAIFHVDDAQTSNADDNHRWVDVEEADGDFDDPGQAADLWYQGHAVTFNSASTPNSNQYNGSPSNVAVTGVSAAGTVMTANFTSCITGGGVDNDDCATATVVTSTPYSDMVNTRQATADANDPVLSCADGGGGKTVWYRYTPSSNVTVTVNTTGSTPDDYDTALGVFTGSCNSLVEVACNDDINPGVIRQSELEFEALAGVTYYIHVAEWNGGGPNGGVPTGGDLVFNLTTSGSSGFASVSQGVTVSPDPVTLGQTFQIDFTLLEVQGASITFDSVSCAILKSNGDFLFDFTTFDNVTVPANGTWQYSATGVLFTSNPPGTYQAVARGKVLGGNWFDFTTTGSGVNHKSFQAVTGNEGCEPQICPGAAIFLVAEGATAVGDTIFGGDGETICIDIRLKENTNSIDAFGLNVQVDPSHLSFVSSEAGDLTDGWTVIDASENPAGSGNIVVGGFHTTAIPPNSAGVLIRLCFQVACEEGNQSEITISNLTDDISSFAACCNFFACAVCVSDGDVNGDGSLTPGDALCAFQIFLNGGNLPADCDEEGFDCELIAADVNCDGTATPGDALAIFQRFLQGGLPEACFAQTLLGKQLPQTASYRIRFDQRIIVQPTSAADGRDLVKLTMNLENPAGLDAFGLELSFPQDRLEFIGIERGGLMGDWTQLDGRSTRSGIVTLGGFNVDELNENTTGDLLHVLFAAREKQNSAYGFHVLNLTDDLSQSAALPLPGSAEIASVPKVFKLYQSFPNPFSGHSATLIRFDLPGSQEQKVELSIYNVAGQIINRLVSDIRGPGAYEISWDGRDDQSRRVPSGTYIYRLEAGELIETKRMTVIR